MYKYDALVQNGQNTTHPVTVLDTQHNDSDLKNKVVAEPHPSFHSAALPGRSRNISLALAALLLHIALVALLVVVVLVPISLTSSGSLSSQNNTLYITGITVIATLATSFTKNQIRELWLRNVDVRLSRGDNPGLANTYWRTALGVASTRETMGHWDIYFTFLAAALSTTAIVAGLAASPATRLVPYEYLLADAFDYSCVKTSDSISSAGNSWKLSNGSYLSVGVNYQFCPTIEPLTLMGTMNVLDPQDYGYADLGVAVRQAALGAPGSIYSTLNPPNSIQLVSPLNNTLDQFGASLMSTSTCAPVLTSNPVQCSKGNASFSSGYLTIASDDGSCSSSLYVGSNPSNNGGWSTGNMCSRGAVGQATVVAAGLNSDAYYAAVSMGDVDWINEDYNDSFYPLVYGIICAVDTSTAIQLRNLTLTFSDPFGQSRAYSRVLDADESSPCYSDFQGTPISSVNDKLKAISAFGPWQLLPYSFFELIRPFIQTTQLIASENTNHSLWVRAPPFAYANSRNALEDVLGVASALALARTTIVGGSGADRYIGSATIAYNRIGIGKRLALLYVLPSLTTVVILVWLLATTPRKGLLISSSRLVDLCEFAHRGDLHSTS
ncbi:hypothetical protein OIDMADRAFT_148305 [Oidiodendron maius Zn]|uniref:Uncharacterized protein n=1 Tax=Oidiodendron maius (strain Zn) TaxID=913774 RepID=A0A0C3GZ43_OIDMZ|nr:hypothetical protein OIDMADRAFT_148305 [Oidiodendron maius Zn]